jgi:SAM-dependent methyltransferase
MPGQVTYLDQTSTAAEIYERAFVPAIAEPVSGRLLDLARLQAGEHVLDLACGTGIIATKAAAAVGPAGSVVGADVAPDMIAVAAARPRMSNGAPIEWKEADAANPPFDDHTFDCVLCQMGLMFVDRVAALPEVRRVLRPGGRFALNTPGAIQPPLEILDAALVRHVDPDLGGFVRAVFSLHDPDALATLLRDCEFGDVTVELRTVPLLLPTPAEFLWQYIGATPLGGFVGAAPDETKRALEDDVVAQWQAFVGDDGRLDVEQPMVYGTAVSS